LTCNLPTIRDSAAEYLTVFYPPSLLTNSEYPYSSNSCAIKPYECDPSDFQSNDFNWGMLSEVMIDLILVFKLISECS
jgi:hypothetical protein